MARHHGRELALKALFEYDLTKFDALALVSRVIKAESGDDRRFVEGLVNGVLAQESDIDRTIEENAIQWRVNRMPTVDRNILRLATFELMSSNDVPISVIIDEALELAQVYSTEQSKKFINGVLGQVAAKFRPEGDRDRLDSAEYHDVSPGE